jgi:hypothetical protein
VAARLQQAAEPTQILVGPTTRRLAAEGFDFAPMPQLDLKGKAEPVEAWRLVRALPQRPRVRGGEAPLVGRKRELRLLEAALETAGDGHGLLVGLSGEAGIGKSRLALELRHRAESDGFESSWTSAMSYASSFPERSRTSTARGVRPGAASVIGPSPRPALSYQIFIRGLLARLLGRFGRLNLGKSAPQRHLRRRKVR